jgi:hypothetical protein
MTGLNVTGVIRRDEDSLPADLRDMLTRRRLVDAVAHLHDVEVIEFCGDWWDGQAHAPCLVVRGGRRHRLLRVVETGGEAVVVPFDARTAHQQLADRRRPMRSELSVPAQRPSENVVVDGFGDVLRCRSAGCGALLPLGYEGVCPVCGADPMEEKSTATGARTAGSSTSK